MKMDENYLKEPTILPNQERERVEHSRPSRKMRAKGRTSPGSERTARKPNVGRPTPWKDAALTVRTIRE